MYTTIIQALQLAEFSAQQCIILDCRHDLQNPDAGVAAYAAGHIPNAHFIHLDQDLSAPKLDQQGGFRGRHPLPSKSDFSARLRKLGVNAETQVIIYDAHGGMFAARCWWMLRWLGHAQVAVLDGGLNAWTAAGFALTEQVPLAYAGNIQEQTSLVGQVAVEDVLANLQTQQKILVDARAADRYRGENESLDPVGGHIPGALNRFFKDNLTADGHFKTPAQLQIEWKNCLPLGEVDARRAIMQCGSGVTACHNLLALEIAGWSGAALYPGSWSEWCADPARPVARTGV